MEPNTGTNQSKKENHGCSVILRTHSTLAAAHQCFLSNVVITRHVKHWQELITQQSPSFQLSTMHTGFELAQVKERTQPIPTDL